jgi:hypothetical protein
VQDWRRRLPPRRDALLMRPKAAHVPECATGQTRTTGRPCVPVSTPRVFCYDHQIMRPITETILLALLVLLTLAMLTEAASAQQRTFYDAGRKVSGLVAGFFG